MDKEIKRGIGKGLRTLALTGLGWSALGGAIRSAEGSSNQDPALDEVSRRNSIVLENPRKPEVSIPVHLEGVASNPNSPEKQEQTERNLEIGEISWLYEGVTNSELLPLTVDGVTTLDSTLANTLNFALAGRGLEEITTFAGARVVSTLPQDFSRDPQMVLVEVEISRSDMTIAKYLLPIGISQINAHNWEINGNLIPTVYNALEGYNLLLAPLFRYGETIYSRVDESSNLLVRYEDESFDRAVAVYSPLEVDLSNITADLTFQDQVAFPTFLSDEPQTPDSIRLASLLNPESQQPELVPTPGIVRDGQLVNIRTGPGLGYESIGQTTGGEIFQFVARFVSDSEGRTWLGFFDDDNDPQSLSGLRWIAAEFVHTDINKIRLTDALGNVIQSQEVPQDLDNLELGGQALEEFIESYEFRETDQIRWFENNGRFFLEINSQILPVRTPYVRAEQGRDRGTIPPAIREGIEQREGSDRFFNLCYFLDMDKYELNFTNSQGQPSTFLLDKIICGIPIEGGEIIKAGFVSSPPAFNGNFSGSTAVSFDGINLRETPYEQIAQITQPGTRIEISIINMYSEQGTRQTALRYGNCEDNDYCLAWLAYIREFSGTGEELFELFENRWVVNGERYRELFNVGGVNVITINASVRRYGPFP